MSTTIGILRTFLDETNGFKITAIGGLNYINGNDSPYFSLTCDHRNITTGLLVSSGIDHEKLISLWPELRPLADIHLSSIDGVPLHAEHNGWHFLSGAAGGLGERYCALTPTRGGVQRSELDCLVLFSRHCRIELATADELRQQVIAVFQKTGAADAKALFSSWIDGQKTRWKIEADIVINNFGLKVFGDPWYADSDDKKPNLRQRNKP